MTIRRFEIRIRIVAADSIRDSVQTEISDSQVSTEKIILKLLNENFSYAKIADVVSISRSCVFGFVKHHHQQKSVENAFRTAWPRKTTDRVDRLIVWHVVKNSRMPLSHITSAVNEGSFVNTYFFTHRSPFDDVMSFNFFSIFQSLSYYQTINTVCGFIMCYWSWMTFKVTAL